MTTDQPISETTKLGIEISVDLHAKVKTEAARRRLKMRDAVREAFEYWLDAPGGRLKAGPEPSTPTGVEVFDAQLTLLQTINSKLDSVLELLKVTHGAIGGIASQQHEQDRDRTLQQLAEATDEIRRDLATVRTRGKPLSGRPKNSLRTG